MLECGENYGGSMKKTCDTCDRIDNEDHRLNLCSKWGDINHCRSDDKVSFEQIYSTDLAVLKHLIPLIEGVWNTKNGHSTMNVK